jgi:putative nucleotidyltransferase with HDIG domain
MTISPTTPPRPASAGQRLLAWWRAVWRRLTAPSPRLVEPDRRRQAQLLASLLVIIVPLGLISELITVLTIIGPYTGYVVTLGASVPLAVAYVLARTERFQWGAILTTLTSAVAVYVGAIREPRAVPGGFLDYLFVPLLLSSAFLSRRQILLFSLANLAGLLLLPILVPAISFETVTVGPLIFFLLSAVIMLFLTRHRDQLEQDRLANVRQAETYARQEAARTAALLRVSERLNSLLDLEAVLATVCEETARALEVPTALISLYDEPQDQLVPAAQVGLPDGAPPLRSWTRGQHEAFVQRFGSVALLPNRPALLNLPGMEFVAGLTVGRGAYATLEYESRLVGSLVVADQSHPVAFSEDDRLLLGGLAHQAALSIVNTRLYKDARRRLERLQALRTIDQAIASNRDLRSTLNLLLEQICQQLGVDAALVLLLDVSQQRLVFAAGLGFRTQALHATRLRLGDGHAGQAALRRALLPVPDLKRNPGTFSHAPLLEDEGFVSYCAAPLIAKDEVRGVVEVFHRAPLTIEPEWLAFLEALAGQAAIAIDNTTLLTDLQHSNVDLAQAYDATIEGWSHALDLRDKETEGHTQRVTELTLALAKRVGGFDEAGLLHVRRGALLHDIGKMGVPDSILLKPGPLTDAEWIVMRRHPVYAYEMLRLIEYLRPALDIPYHHHEKWDGTGYPSGLKGEQIPIAARLFAVVDIWDALRSDRPYRPAWAEEKVRAHLAELAGSHLDPELVAAFLGMLDEITRDG